MYVFHFTGRQECMYLDLVHRLVLVKGEGVQIQKIPEMKSKTSGKYVRGVNRSLTDLESFL